MRVRQSYTYSVRIAHPGSRVIRIVCETHVPFWRGQVGDQFVLWRQMWMILGSSFDNLGSLGEGFVSSWMYLGRFWASLDASWTIWDHFYDSSSFLVFEDSFEAQRLEAGQPLTGTFFKICFNFWNPFSFFDVTKACACR